MMLELTKPEVVSVSAAALCLCTSGYTESRCSEMPIGEDARKTLAKTGMLNMSDKERGAFFIHSSWSGDLKKDDCIARCCDVVGTSCWLWGLGQGGHCVF